MLSADTLNDNVWMAWLVRAVVTFVLVMGYHYCTTYNHKNGKSQPAGAVGVPLEQDWKEKRLQALLKQQEQENRQEQKDESRNEDTPPPQDEQESETLEEEEPQVTTATKQQEEEQQEESHVTTATKQQETQHEEEENVLVDEPRVKSQATSTTTTSTTTTSTTTTEPPRPLLSAKSDKHQGLAQFHHWYNVETSLYRIYERGRTDGVPVIPPFLPKSERGNVPVSLIVGNKYREPILVYWVNYKGALVQKGKINMDSTWHQTTWIGHPWTFCTADGEVLLHYIPYRIIPTTQQVPTIDPNDDSQGLHQFIIGKPAEDSCYSCTVIDPVMPLTLETPEHAAQWTLQHMTRMNYAGVDILQKYLTKIVMHPGEVKYRQIRIAQRMFWREIYNTSARGLLLSLGFVEHGAYMELGTNEALSRQRVRDVSLVLFALEQWKREQNVVQQERQPQGADGYGRAGFGRAGQMNLE